MQRLRLRWTEVDLPRKHVVFRETKNRRQRGAPVSAPPEPVISVTRVSNLPTKPCVGQLQVGSLANALV